VADYYDIRQLTEECGSCMFKNMDEDNYIDVLSLAENYQLTEPNVEYLALKLYTKELMKKFDLKIKPGLDSRIC